MTIDLSAEARCLVDCLDKAIAGLYEEHPHLGSIPKDGTGQRRRKLRETRAKAWRRLARRRYVEGNPLPIQGAMWLVNGFDSGYF